MGKLKGFFLSMTLLAIVSAMFPAPLAADSDSPVIEATDLGYPNETILAGTVSTQVFSIPVPDGMHLQKASFELRLSPTVSDGMLTFSDSAHVLSTLTLPTPSSEVSVDLSSATVKNGFATLELKSVLQPDDSTCGSTLLKWLSISNMRFVLSGDPKPPDTVADFWPPDLREVHFYLTSTPDKGAADAVLTISAFAQRLAAGHGITVTVRPLTDPLPFPVDDPFSRSVIVETDRSMLSPKVSLVRSAGRWPVLLLSARPEHMPVASRMVVGAAKPFLFSTRNTLRYYRGSAQEPLSKITLSSLGYGNTVLQGNSQMSAAFRFSQADLGSSVKGVSVRLIGRHTPVPKGGIADLSILMNGGLIYSIPLGKESSFDVYATVPRSLLRRDNRMEVRVLYTPPGNDCAVGAHDIEIDIEPDSYLEVERGRSLSPGFDRFPQALLPSFTVAFDDLSMESLQDAAGLIADLQRLSRTPLKPSVASLGDALKGNSPLLAIVDDPTNATLLSPPLSPLPFRLLDPYGNVVMELDQGTRFAVLEAFTVDRSKGLVKGSRSRETLLLTSNGYREGMADIVSKLSHGDGWYGLSGDVLILPEGRKPIQVPVRSGHFQVKPAAETPAVWWHKLRIVVYIFSTVLVFIFLLVTYPRVVRKGPSA